MTRSRATNRERLGFRDGDKGVHSSRTMMFAELVQLLAATAPDATITDFRRAVVEHNVLGKRTATTREHTVRKLKALYGLDPALPVYRLLRFLWDQDHEGRPMMALLCAVARDPLLCATMDAILELPTGTPVPPELLEATVSQRFAAKTRRSIGQNLASTWMKAGYLTGVQSKARTRAHATPGTAAYALALGFMEGQRGTLLLSTPWTRLLDRPAGEVLALVQQAARRGWVEYRAAGDVIDLRVDPLLTEAERRLCDAQPG